MKKGLLFVLLLVSFVGFGQCPTDIIRLDSQAEIDSFATDYPDCVDNVKLIIEGGIDITNLNGLSHINTFSDLFLSGLPTLRNLQGLENVTRIDYFDIYFLPEFESFEGLSSLSRIGNFRISYLESLYEIQGLDSLTTIYAELYIYGVPNLTNLDAFHNVTEIGSVELRGNASLNSIQGLANIDTETRNPIFKIWFNPNLSQCAIESICEVIDFGVFVDGNGIGCSTVMEIRNQCQLSITEEDFLKNLSFFPNPVTTFLNIETSNSIVFEKATIYSTWGKLIFESSEKQINLENLSAGIYFVEVVTDKGSVTKKIIKN